MLWSTYLDVLYMFANGIYNLYSFWTTRYCIFHQMIEVVLVPHISIFSDQILEFHSRKCVGRTPMYNLFLGFVTLSDRLPTFYWLCNGKTRRLLLVILLRFPVEFEKNKLWRSPVSELCCANIDSPVCLCLAVIARL